jgi:hypothetical protein
MLRAPSAHMRCRSREPVPTPSTDSAARESAESEPGDSAEFSARWPRLAPRLCYLTLSAAQFRLRFFAAWAFTEAAGLLFGLPPDVASNVDLRGLELTCSFRSRARAWNRSVARWLAECVYRRLPLRSRPVRMLAVFAVSAFWHDQAPPTFKYWATFLQLPFYAFANDFACAHVYAPLAAMAAPVPAIASAVRALAWANEAIASGYFTTTFAYGDRADILAKWRAWGYYGHWYCAAVAALALLRRLLGAQRPRGRRVAAD